MPNNSNMESLHTKQIEYATSNNRMFIIHWIQTWNEFKRLTSDTIYFDLSAEDARDNFLTVVLPNIYTYDLTNEQIRYVRLLKNSEYFLTTENGFKYLGNKTINPISECPTDTTKNDSELLLLSNENYNRYKLKGSFNDATIPAITVASIAVSTMPELILRKLLKPAEIYRRLRNNNIKLDYKKQVTKLKKYDNYTRLFHKFLQNKYKKNVNPNLNIVRSDQSNQTEVNTDNTKIN